jgi:hypothetical protein
MEELEMKTIELCQYTLRQSLSDPGRYTEQTAEEIVNAICESCHEGAII